LLFGDLHRHTELSVCRTGVDGGLEDAHRYAIDAVALDFLCVTDHVQHVKILNDYDIWRTGKAADLNRSAGAYEPLYGYERSQRFPFGHRNIIGAVRYPARIPRTADNRPFTANESYPGEVLTPPSFLWKELMGLDVVTIPHTTGNPVMGTDFEYPPAEMEPVVEIYQGCRQSYEHAGAPDPRRTPKTPNFGGKTQAAGLIWSALEKGFRYGFIASSDHVATHNSYACVWAERCEPSAILAALRARRTYAATDRIICEMRMGGHWMGEEFEAREVPPLEVRVAGTTEIARIDVIRDNRVVFAHVPGEPAREVSFAYRDAGAAPGTHYYYARVIQKDNNMAWISPIWVNVPGEAE
ncbi:MAG: hypothetical protein JXP34_15920, partial [Planctomycetes bacterium]|nr:hypothetical protein [Planctomycetota bacterium]